MPRTRDQVIADCIRTGEVQFEPDLIPEVIHAGGAPTEEQIRADFKRAFGKPSTLPRWAGTKTADELVQEAQRLRRRGRAVTLLIALGLVAALGMMALSAGCAARPAVLSSARAPAEQTASAVTIEASCAGAIAWHGSGSIIGSDVVLTARHVAQGCKDGSRPALRVTYADGGSTAATVSWADPVFDLAELFAPGAEPVGQTTIASPALGGELCAEVAWPTRHRLCGAAVALAVRALANGTVNTKIGMVATRGNSGSAIYDAHGRLVAVLTNVENCPGSDDHYCATLAASVIGRLP